MIQEVVEFQPPISGIVFLMLGAVWCKPCQQMHPFVEELSGIYSDILFLYADAEKSPAIIKKYQIMSLPTVLLFQDRVLAKKTVGYRNNTEIKKMLEDAMLKVKEGRII